MSVTLDIQLEHLKIVQDILQEYLPPQSTVWVFGSRAKGRARKYSDLDLMVDANGKPLSLSISGDLREAFDESDLPYKVDVVDWVTISDSFREIIRHDRVLLPR